MLDPINDNIEWNIISQTKKNVKEYSEPNTIASHSISQKHCLDDSEDPDEQLKKKRKLETDLSIEKKKKRNTLGS